MNEEELRNRFNESLEDKPQAEVKPYRATKNLNVALSNPQMMMNDSMESNISNSNIDNTMSINTTTNEPVMPTPEPSSDIPTTPVEPVQQPKPEVVDESSFDVTEKYYEEQPIYDMQTNRTTTYIATNNEPRKKTKIVISKEMQIFLLIVIVMFIFIMILPVISDLF